jgi:hypothetical protein
MLTPKVSYPLSPTFGPTTLVALAAGLVASLLLGVLALEHREFDTRIFCLVLVGNCEPLEFGVALLNVLLKVCDIVVGRL